MRSPLVIAKQLDTAAPKTHGRLNRPLLTPLVIPSLNPLPSEGRPARSKYPLTISEQV